jgi:hypothetical protein
VVVIPRHLATAPRGALVHTTVTSRTFFVQNFFGSSYCRGLRESNCSKHHSTEARQRLFTNNKRLGGYKWKRGALRIYGFTIEPCSYELHIVLNASPSSLLHLRDGPSCHQLNGGLGVPAPEACQHILCHCHCQGTVLCLQLAADDFLQL